MRSTIEWITEALLIMVSLLRPRLVRVVLFVSELSFTITKRRTVISKVIAIGGSKELVPCAVPGQGLDNVVTCAKLVQSCAATSIPYFDLLRFVTADDDDSIEAE